MTCFPLLWIFQQGKGRHMSGQLMGKQPPAHPSAASAVIASSPNTSRQTNPFICGTSLSGNGKYPHRRREQTEDPKADGNACKQQDPQP